MPRPDRYDVWLATAVGAASLAIYAHTVDRGFGGGDIAEMQMSSISLGICHPPGYALQSLVGHLFTYLPIGSLPMRVNLLSAVSGAACVALLYGVLRHLDIGRTAAAAGVLALAVSDLFWRHARYAEVYTFHTMLLAAVMLCAVRNSHTRRGGWLVAEVFLIGLYCSARPSVVLLLPALAVFHWFEHKRGNDQSIRVSPIRRAMPLFAAFVLPFLLTFAYFVWRDQPSTLFNYLAFKPDLRPFIESADGAWLPDNDSLTHRAQRAVWIMTVGPFRRCFTPVGYDLISGASYYFGRFVQTDLTLAAVILIPLGLWRWRRQPAALALTLGIWGGNFLFYSTYASGDRITFTLPGLSALAMLMAAGIDQLLLLWPRGGLNAARVAVFIPAILLVLHNHEWNDASQPVRLAEKINERLPDPLLSLDPVLPRYATLRVLQTPLPSNARIFSYFGLARAMQYYLQFEQGRDDVEIIGHDDPRVWEVAATALDDGRPTFVWMDDGLTPLPPR